MRPVARLTILIAALGLAFGGCRNGPSGAGAGAVAAPSGTAVSSRPVVVLHAGDRALPIRVEIARTEPERERGLMYRNHLDPDAGMLFIFDRPGPLTFWMKNTLIPLDMIFIGSDRHVVGIVEDAAPETETPRRVPGESLYVLEISGGMSRHLGVVAGSAVDFQGVPRDPTLN